MNGIVEFFKSVFGTISTAIAPFVSLPLLSVVGLLVYIAWLAEPGKGLKRFNKPVVTWIAIVVAVFIGLQSLTFLTTAGLKTTDRLIIAQIVIVIALFVLMGYYQSRVVKIILWVLVFFVFGAIVVTGFAGPPDSLMSFFVRTVQSAFSTIVSSFKRS